MNTVIVVFFCLSAAAFSVGARRMQHIRQSVSQLALSQSEADMQLQAELKLVDNSGAHYLIAALFELAIPSLTELLSDKIKSGLYGCVGTDGRATQWFVGAAAECPGDAEKVHYTLDPMDLKATAKPRIVPVHEHEQCIDFRVAFGEVRVDQMNKLDHCKGPTVVAEGGCGQLTGLSDFHIDRVDMSATTTDVSMEMQATFPRFLLKDCHFMAKEKSTRLGFAVKGAKNIQVGEFTVGLKLTISKIDFLNIIKDAVPAFCDGKGATLVFLENLQLTLEELVFTVPNIISPKWVVDKSKGVQQVAPAAPAAMTLVGKHVTKVLREHIKPAEKRMQELLRKEINELMKDNFAAMRNNPFMLAEIDKMLGDVAAAKFSIIKDVGCGLAEVAEVVGEAAKAVVSEVEAGFNAIGSWLSRI